MLIRVYLEEKITTVGLEISLSEKQCNYLHNVLRLKSGDTFNVFDNQNGEFLAKISQITHKKGNIIIEKKLYEYEKSPDIWLLFAPLKKDKTDIVIQKSTELGVRKIIPVITDYTNSEKARIDRYLSQCIEASEQSRRTDIPEISQPRKLRDVIHNWESDRVLFFLDESGAGENIFEILSKNKGKAAILVGPEGGFSPQEQQELTKQSFVKKISLGKRILRAETAVISSLSCWQAINGDW